MNEKDMNMEAKKAVDKMFDSTNFDKASPELRHRFMEVYSPYTLEDYSLPERRPEDIRFSAEDNEEAVRRPGFAEFIKEARKTAADLDKKRKEDPFCGSMFASQIIFDKMLEMAVIREGGDTDPVTLLAMAGTFAGMECRKAVLGAAKGFTAQEQRELGMVAIKFDDGNVYLRNSIMTSEFSQFCKVVLNDDSAGKDEILDISDRTSKQAGKPEYHETKYDGEAALPLPKLMDFLGGCFDALFELYTRTPQERVAAGVFTARRAYDRFKDEAGADKAFDILLEYGWRAAFCMYPLREGGNDLENVAASPSELKNRFFSRYSPFTVKGFEMPERFKSDGPVPEGEDETGFRTVTESLNEQLRIDPFVCAKYVSKKLLDRLASDLQEDDGSINAVKLFAVLGAVGGYELMRGIINSVSDFTPEELTSMSIMIVEMKNGQRYLMGDLVGNAFVNFYFNAAQDTTVSIEPLKKQSEICAKNIGTPAYWETSVDLHLTPRIIAENFAAHFNGLLETYTRYPAERVMAYALAAVELMRQTEKVMPKERALEILAEHGWRTSHFIG